MKKQPLSKLENCKFLFRLIKKFKNLTFQSSTMDYTESGIQTRMEKKMKANSASILMKNKIYTTVEEYVNGNAKFDALILDNFATFFAIYFIIRLIIFIAFAFEHCYHRTKKWISFFVLITKKAVSPMNTS